MNFMVTSGRELLRHSVESAPPVQPEARSHRGLGRHGNKGEGEREGGVESEKVKGG